jgi:hypothetical protein
MFSFFSPQKIIKKALTNFKSNSTYVFSSVTAIFASSVLPSASACQGVDINDDHYSISTHAIYGNNILESNLAQKVVAACKAKIADVCLNSCSQSFFWNFIMPLNCKSEGGSAYGLSTVTAVLHKDQNYNDCLKQVLQANSPSGFGSSWGDYAITACIFGAGLMIVVCAKKACSQKPQRNNQDANHLAEQSASSGLESANNLEVGLLRNAQEESYSPRPGSF